MPIQQLLLSNIGRLPDLDKDFQGQVLKLCNIDPPPKAIPRLVRAAAINKKLGFSIPVTGLLHQYVVGVLEVLLTHKVSDLVPSTAALPVGTSPLVRPKVSPVIGSGEGALLAMALCSGVNFSQIKASFRRRNDKVRQLPSRATGMVAREFKEFVSEFKLPALAYRSCSGKAIVSLTSGDGSEALSMDGLRVQLYQAMRVSNFTSNRDMQDAVEASDFLPVPAVSGATTTAFSFRGIGGYAGYYSAPLPDCLPDVEYCVHISPLPAPSVQPGVDMGTGTQIFDRLMTKHPPDVKLAELVQDSVAVAANIKRLASEPKAASNNTNSTVAWSMNSLGVDIAPNLHNALPISDVSPWRTMQGMTGTKQVDEFLFNLGRADALAWIRFIRLAK
jgi:hypothetical protein